jgi:hypothetical protein
VTGPRRQVPSLAEFLADTGHGRAVRGLAAAVRKPARPQGKGRPAALRQGVVTAVNTGTAGIGPTLDVRMDGDSTNGTVVPAVLSACPVLPQVGDMVWCLKASSLLIAVACNRFTQEDITTYALAAAASTTVLITYPVPFSAKPSLVAEAANAAGVRVNTYILNHVTSGSLYTGANVRVQQNENVAVTTNGDLSWVAAGRG